MQLYFSPLACSLATRIALYAAGAEASYTQVDLRTKRAADGADFFAVNPMGQVPALRVADDDVVTENQAVLQYVADRYPAAGLAPASGRERARLQQWLCFIGTELHKGVFIPLVDPASTEGAKEYARQKAPARFAVQARAFGPCSPPRLRAEAGLAKGPVPSPLRRAKARAGGEAGGGATNPPCPEYSR